MKTTLIIFQILFLLIIGCKENTLIDRRSSLEPELVNKFEETDIDLIINPTLTNILLIKSKEQGKVFITKNSEKTFEYIRDGIRAFHFDNKFPKTIYLTI